ncbi:hypothetical protein ACIGHN_13395 [Acidovorax sp. NPDC077693]|uniref:hypothetical protein n=1 Tax=unclassified Acidovorax TaxID=2684926 RepID=UPI0037CA79D3
MARRIAYTGAPVLTAQDIATWRRNDAVLLESDLLETIIIPGVIGQAESRTGAAIRQATYQEHWPASYASGHALDMGQASEIKTVEIVGPDGAATPTVAARYLERGQRLSFLHFPAGRPPGGLLITYEAGADLAAYPAVKNWLLMHIGTVYAQRESLVIGASVAELPPSFLDHMLAEITVPPRF